MEGKIYIPPLEILINTMVSKDLVEGGSEFAIFFLILKLILNIAIQTLQNRECVYNDAY